MKGPRPRTTRFTNTYTRETITPEAWIEALESGEYTKARGLLCRGGTRMCCLGVLSDMIGAPMTRVYHSLLPGEPGRVLSLGMPAPEDMPDWLRPHAERLAMINDSATGYPIGAIREVYMEEAE